MAWTNKKGFNFRSTSGYVTDGTNEGYVASTSSNILAYPQSMTIDGDTFNVGWNTGGVDGTRNRSTSVDVRLAGVAGIFSPGTLGTFRINAGTAAGQYKIWLGSTDQAGGTTLARQFALRDSNGTLSSWSGVTFGGTSVVDAAGNNYASAAAWAAAADGAGMAITVTTTDTSNGAGGPIFYFDMGTSSVYTPLAHIAIQYLGTGVTLDPITSCFPIGYYE